MKKSNLWMISIFLVIFAALICFVAVLLSDKNEKEEEIINTVETVRKNYANLTEENTNNISIRKEMINKLNSFNNEEYPSIHENYLETLNNYNNSVNKIKDYVTILNEKCATNVEEGTTNVLCRSYSGIYEEVVNIYITIMTNYNNKITNINKNREEKYELYTMLYTDYLDVNNDGKYLGKDVSIND